MSCKKALKVTKGLIVKRITTLVIMFLSLFLFTTVNATQENIIFSYQTRINQEKLIITEWLNSLNLKHSNSKQNKKE
jgi:YbbR domain-containing protein